MTRRALLVLAVAAGAGCSREPAPDRAVADEVRRREELGQALLSDAGAQARALTSSEDVQFEEGFSRIELVPFDKFDGHAHRWIGQKAHVRLRASDVPMQLHFVAWVNENILHMRPQVAVYIDGQLIGHTPRTDAEGFTFTYLRVDPPWFRGKRWVDLTLEISSVGFHWADPPELQVAQIIDFGWKKAP